MALKIFGIEGAILLEDELDAHTFDYANTATDQANAACRKSRAIANRRAPGVHESEAVSVWRAIAVI